MTVSSIDSWDHIKAAHDELMVHLRHVIEGSTDIAKPMGILVAAAPPTENEQRSRSFLLPDEFAVGLVQTEHKALILSFLASFLDPGAEGYGPGQQLEGWHPLAILTTAESFVVGVTVPSPEVDIASLAPTIQPSQHPDRKDALIVAIHTLAGTKLITHLIESNGPDDSKPRTLCLKPFPSRADFESQYATGRMTMPPAAAGAARTGH